MQQQARLHQRATLQVAKWNTHHAYKPAKPRGDKFAKGHQMVLGVAVGGLRRLWQAQIVQRRIAHRMCATWHQPHDGIGKAR